MVEQNLNFESLAKLAVGKNKKGLILGNSDRRTLEAVSKSVSDGIIEPIELDVSIDSFPELLSSDEFKDHLKQVDLIIPAFAEYDLFLKYFYGSDNPIFVKRFFAHIGLFETSAYSKPLLVTDSLINQKLDLKKKISLVELTKLFSKRIGIGLPCIALLSAVEAIYPQMPATVEAAVLAKMSDRGQFKDCFVDGPLSFDIAVDKDAAISKGIINSEVAGQADALIAPDIATGNGIYQAASQFVKADIGGLILGGSLPVAHSFPDEPIENRFNSILLSALMS